MSIDRSEPADRVAAHHRAGRGVERFGYPIEVRQVRVARRELVTPRMLRLTMTGKELAGFDTYAADDHVKIVFARPDGTRADPVPGENRMLRWPRPLPPTRCYTVRRFDAERLELDLDFVVHDGGLAADWAMAAEVGAKAVIAGPPGAKAFAHTYRHYVFAVDVTALPAVARWLDEADWLEGAGAGADIVVDHDHPAQTAYPLRERAGVRVRWLSRVDGSRLAGEVAALSLPTADVFLFAAGEAGDLKPLRGWASEHGHDALFTGYWKRGVAGAEES